MRQFTRFYKENFGSVSTSDKPTFRAVNVHAHNGCNLACKGCNHNSSVLAVGSSVNVDQMLDDLDNILPRIHIWSHISLLGGEPLLEPRCEEILTKIEELVDCRIKLFSNAILLHKNQDWIIEHMRRGTILRLSMHVSPFSPKGKLNYKNVHEFIEYAEDKVDLESTLEISEPWNEKWFDMLRWEDNKFHPYEDNDIESSWNYCTCPQMQIYNGHLWKCASIAYLRETLRSTQQIDDSEWQKYLKYKPTRVDAPIEDIYKMADGQNKSHSICNMCPANPKWFRAHRQLTDVKKVVPQSKIDF